MFRTPSLAAAVALAIAFAVVGVGVAVSPRSRRQLRHLGRKTGIGPVLAAALALAFCALFVSAFAVAGASSARSDGGIVLAALALLAGLFGTGVGVAALPDYLAVRRADRRDAAAAAAGSGGGTAVAVEGTVALEGDPLSTPFTGADAVCYDARVLEDHGSTGGVEAEGLGLSGSWRVEYAETRGVPFAVEDGTGRVAVDPTALDRRLDRTAEVRVDVDEALPDRIGDFLEANLAAVGYAGHDRRYVEAALRPSDPATVVGRAADPAAGVANDPADPGSDARGVAGARARIEGEGEGDGDGDGGGPAILASGSLADLRDDLRRRVVRVGGAGLLATALGYAGLLVAADAI